MKKRTGIECKKTNCQNYEAYSHWFNHLGSGVLQECMNCKHCFVSQYKKTKEQKK